MAQWLKSSTCSLVAQLIETKAITFAVIYNVCEHWAWYPPHAVKHLYHVKKLIAVKPKL